MMSLGMAVFAALFSVVNPLGAVPVFLALTPKNSESERRQIAWHTCMYVAMILISFFLAGSVILSFFGISLDAMRIAGGFVILLSGFTLLNGKFSEGRAISEDVVEEALEKEDISFAPMAMPMLAGPGSISLLIGMYAEHQDWSHRGLILGVIVLTALVCYFILLMSPRLFRILGIAGLKAISRIMGFLVMAIGVQYITVGIVSLVRSILAA